MTNTNLVIPCGLPAKGTVTEMLAINTGKCCDEHQQNAPPIVTHADASLCLWIEGETLVVIPFQIPWLFQMRLQIAYFSLTFKKIKLCFGF